MLQHCVPARPTELRRSASAELRLSQSVRRADGLVQQGTLRADSAEVGGRIFNAADAFRFALAPLDAQTATDTAVRADGLTQRDHGTFLCGRGAHRAALLQTE